MYASHRPEWTVFDILRNLRDSFGEMAFAGFPRGRRMRRQ